uniref:F-box domain-containing protein n=1 Tax=Opuntia streptacantha TaxID=393608 RepID=A0A7C9AMC6_OPUST
MMGFNKLPEECVSTILSLSTPRDACRAAAACSALLSAATSDFVWESFLPNDYNEILSRADQSLVGKVGSKKELFFMLCSSLPIDAGNKIFMLERSKGLKSYILSARELKIAWANDPMYWSWKYVAFSRFSETAELRTTSWLEIQGKIKTKWLSPNTTYAAYLIFKTSARAYGLDTMPMEASVQVGNDPVCRSAVQLHQDAGPKHQIERLLYGNRIEMLSSRVVQGPTTSVSVTPSARDGGWMEIELGKFYSGKPCDRDDHEDDREVKMSLMEIKGHHLKGGLVVEGLEIRPI